MKDLIRASKIALQNELGYVRSRDIYVTEDIRLIRNAGDYPAIGIKDGRTDFATLASDQGEEAMHITFVAYVQLYKPESGIMGEVSTDQKGVLDVAQDIIATLRNNDLNYLVASALPVTQAESEILSDGHRAIIMVPVTMKYTRFDIN